MSAIGTLKCVSNVLGNLPLASVTIESRASLCLVHEILVMVNGIPATHTAVLCAARARRQARCPRQTRTSERTCGFTRRSTNSSTSSSIDIRHNQDPKQDPATRIHTGRISCWNKLGLIGMAASCVGKPNATNTIIICRHVPSIWLRLLCLYDRWRRCEVL